MTLQILSFLLESFPYVSTLCCLSPKICIVFFLILRKTTLTFTLLYLLNYIRGSGIAFYVSYIHSRTMYQGKA